VLGWIGPASSPLGRRDTMASNGNTMAPTATHDTSRTAIPPVQPAMNEKKGLFGRRHHATPPSTDARGGAYSTAPGPYGHSFKFGHWLK
jgi:hypothetical protein